MMRFNETGARGAQVLGFALVAIALSTFVSQAAFAQSASGGSTQFTTAASSLQTVLYAAAKAAAGIAFIGAGLAKWAGRMNWGHFGAVCVGCCIIGGSAWLVGLMIG